MLTVYMLNIYCDSVSRPSQESRDRSRNPALSEACVLRFLPLGVSAYREVVNRALHWVLVFGDSGTQYAIAALS